MQILSEDRVRQKAQSILGFIDDEKAKSGVGQLTNFNELGLKAITKSQMVGIFQKKLVILL